MKKLTKGSLATLILCTLATLGHLYWAHQTRYPSTNDAYVQAHVIQIAAQVSGPVSKVYVKDLASVKQGDLLFKIDPRPFEYALTKAKAQLDQVEKTLASQQETIKANEAIIKLRQAALELAENNAKRIIKLVDQKVLAETRRDLAIKQLKSAQASLTAAMEASKSAQALLGASGKLNAQYRSAEAALKQATLNLKHTQVLAPANGALANFHLRIGSIIQAHTPLFALVEKNNWWIMANFKETALTHIQPKQPATIRIDMYPQKRLKGFVESVGAGSSSSFSLLPPENATGNWVKITQRFPVKIQPLNRGGLPLRLGASSTVTIDTQSHLSPHKK